MYDVRASHKKRDARTEPMWLELLLDVFADTWLLFRSADRPLNGDPPRRHPYESRTALRTRLPSFLVKRGIAAKGRDCETVGGRHLWYNKYGIHSACYHCRVVRPGQLWKRTPFEVGQDS